MKHSTAITTFVTVCFLSFLSSSSSSSLFVSGALSQVDLPDVQQRTTIEFDGFAALNLNVVEIWTRITMKAILLAPSFFPPTGISRVHGMVAQAHFDSLSFYSDNITLSRDYRTWLPTFNAQKQPTSMRTITNINSTVSYAAYMVLSDVFSTKSASMSYLNNMMSEFGYPVDTPGGEANNLDTNFARGLGNQLGLAIVNEGKVDGYNAHGNDVGATSSTLYANSVNYYPVNNPQSNPGVTDCAADIRSINRWQPLLVPGANGAPAAVQKHASPQVANAKTWALATPSEFRAPMPPLMFTSLESAFMDELKDVLELHNDVRMTDSTKMLAEFFFDGPTTAQPPSHLLMAALILGRQYNLGLVETSKLMFLTAMALGDAGVAAWDTKIFWDAVRPITAIQCLFGNVTANTWAGPYQGVVANQSLSQWKPYQAGTAITPNFSEYISGYAAYAGAATTAMRLFFGSDECNFKHTFPAGSSILEPKINQGATGFVAGITDTPNSGVMSKGYSPAQDLTLSWTSLSDLSRDIAYSRRCGGIHFIYADVNGRQMGQSVANKVYAKYLTLLTDSSNAAGAGTTSSPKGNTIVQINFANMFNGVTVNGATSLNAPTIN